MYEHVSSSKTKIARKMYNYNYNVCNAIDEESISRLWQINYRNYRYIYFQSITFESFTRDYNKA